MPRRDGRPDPGLRAGASHNRIECLIVSPPNTVRTFSSTKTIPSTGTRGATRRSTRARRENKPIFLSIGYSTCHWCHVMEHESFESREIADVLNRHFVSIKVDREERPDVDRVYMTFVQATTGSGGWPMSVWLTPSLQPFYGGTYFPPVVQVGQAGFRRTSSRRSRASGARSATRSSSRRRRSPSACARLRSQGGREPVPPPPSSIARSRSSPSPSIARRGGFGNAPKFPRPSELLFLLREHARTGAERAARHGARHAARDGARRDARPPRRRIPSLFGGRRLARAALREDALRPGAAGAGLRRGRAADRRPLLRRRGHRHARLRARATSPMPAAGSTRPRTPTACRPSRPATPHPHKMEGAFYIWRDDEIRERARRRCRRLHRAVRRPPGRQRAVRPAERVHAQEPALHGAVARRDCRVRPAGRWTRSRQSLRRSRAALCGAAIDAAAAASRRQGPDRLERADDCRLRARRLACWTMASGSCDDARRAADVRAHDSCGTRRPARCCGGIARARRASTATPRTTRI